MSSAVDTINECHARASTRLVRVMNVFLDDPAGISPEHAAIVDVLGGVLDLLKQERQAVDTWVAEQTTCARCRVQG